MVLQRIGPRISDFGQPDEDFPGGDPTLPLNRDQNPDDPINRDPEAEGTALKKRQRQRDREKGGAKPKGENGVPRASGAQGGHCSTLQCRRAGSAHGGPVARR